MEPFNNTWHDTVDLFLRDMQHVHRFTIYPKIEVSVGPGEQLLGEQNPAVPERVPEPEQQSEAEISLGVQDAGDAAAQLVLDEEGHDSASAEPVPDEEDDDIAEPVPADELEHLRRNVLLLDMGMEDLKAGVAKMLGKGYLSPAAQDDIHWPIGGYLYGRNDRPMVNVVLGRRNAGRNDRLVNVFCLVDTGSPTTFLSLDTLEAMGAFASQRARISLHGEDMLVNVSSGHFREFNLIGADFMRKTRTRLQIDYGMLGDMFSVHLGRGLDGDPVRTR